MDGVIGKKIKVTASCESSQTSTSFLSMTYCDNVWAGRLLETSTWFDERVLVGGRIVAAAIPIAAQCC